MIPLYLTRQAGQKLRVIAQGRACIQQPLPINNRGEPR